MRSSFPEFKTMQTVMFLYHLAVGDSKSQLVWYWWPDFNVGGGGNK